MEELIQKIMLKAYQISTRTKADVFINYQSHVNCLYVEIYEVGWKSRLESNLDIKIDLKFESEANKKLKFVLNELLRLEENNAKRIHKN